MRARLSEDTVRLNGGRVLLGGSPLALMRLSAAGAEEVDRLTTGSFVRPDQPTAETRLLDRLIDAGIVDVSLDPTSEFDVANRCTIVIPCHNDVDGLTTTLASCPQLAVVVVDDASDDATAVRAAAEQASATLIRLDRNVGPGAARNTGAAIATTDVLVFIDAGVTWSRPWMESALAWFDVERILVVAPRVRSSPGPSRLERFERDRSPIDLGPRSGPVRPGTRVGYVPTAALMVRRAGFVRAGGFDVTMRYGEDVDLVWRLSNNNGTSSASGNSACRYLGNDAVVEHRPRRSLVTAARQRFGYGTAAAPLDRRHPGAVAPMRASKWSLAVMGLIVTGHPIAAGVVAAGNARALARKLAPLDRGRRHSARLVVRGHVGASEQFLRTMIRPWWPVSATVAVCTRRGRRLVVAALIVPPLLDWNRRRPDLDPATWGALSVADDVAYSVGVWVGCWRERSIRAVLPRLSEWPGAKN